MERERPTSVTVIAIFHLVIGFIGLGCNTCTLLQLASGGNAMAGMFSPPGQQQQQQEMQEQMQQMLQNQAPFFNWYSGIFGVAIPWFLTFALLAAGVGLLQMKPWALKLSIGYGITSILHKLVNGVYTIIYLVPIYSQFFKTVALQQPAPTPAAQAAQIQVMSMMETVIKVSAIMTPFVMMVYPAVMLFILGRQEVRDAFGEREPQPPLSQPPL